ncbi:MAG: hypothetical protein QOF32_1442, partial [Gammaproteobacteria bacterium]|nr:hypothetical protein [Gammaproteobacteria bacterium]
ADLRKSRRYSKIRYGCDSLTIRSVRHTIDNARIEDAALPAACAPLALWPRGPFLRRGSTVIAWLSYLEEPASAGFWAIDDSRSYFLGTPPSTYARRPLVPVSTYTKCVPGCTFAPCANTGRSHALLVLRASDPRKR